jgi:hypothetical protein
VTDLVPYQPTDTWVPVLGAVGDLANKIAGTEFTPKGLRGKAPAVAAAILTGRELGLGPMASLRGLQVIDGSVSMTAQMMAARIFAAHHKVEWLESTDKAAEIRITRGDGLGEAVGRFTIADAQRAGLAGKTNWQRYPRAMLRARALTECAGMICSDVILGLDAVDAPQDGPAASVSTVVQLVPAGPGAGLEPATAEPAHQPDGPDPAGGTHPTGPPEPDPDPAPDPITPRQLRNLGAQIGEWERLLNDGRRLSRDERRMLIAEMVGHPHLLSAKDLTKAEGSTAIEALEALIGAALDADPGTGEVVEGELMDGES